MAATADELGTQDIKKLLIKQAVPASIGILFMSVNILIDTIFVGQWIGSLAIAAVTVVLPITFFISSLGMAIGVGGGSILSRALGANHKEKALHTFGNQIMMTFLLASIFVLFGPFFQYRNADAFWCERRYNGTRKRIFYSHNNKRSVFGTLHDGEQRDSSRR